VSTRLTFEQAVTLYREFLKARNWSNGNPRDLAISISLEANELLEHYQWADTPVGTPDELADELADILLYAIQFADHYGIDIPSSLQNKMEKSAKKYPAEDFTSTDPHALREAWLTAKKRHVKKESL